MASKHIIKFNAIATLFKDDHRQLTRGENAYMSDHIKKFEFHGDVDPWFIKGTVLSSMKLTTYVVEISYHVDRGIVDTKCSCPRGTVICHHVAALLLHAHYNVSSTDVTCQWSQPSGSGGTTHEATSLEDLYPPKAPYSATSTEIAEADIERFRRNLGETNVVGFSWLLKCEVEEGLVQIVPSIEDILFSEEYLNADDKIGCFLEKSSISIEDKQRINQLTVGQHANENWHVTRKMRLTASRFGIVLAACRRNKYPPSLFRTLFEGYSLDKVKAVQWGKNNEETALTAFQTLTGYKVVKSGLWIDCCGFLGASPDGLIGHDAILEIKCPYKFRQSSLMEGVRDKKYFFYYENNEPVIKVDHPYYHQIQGQLHITERERCYFFVWTPTEEHCITIEKDPDWYQNVEVLKTFYLEQFLPACLDLHLEA